MDTTWFAVDVDGRVARLDSGEGGAVPVEGFPSDGFHREQFDGSSLIAALLRKRAETDERLARLLPEDDELLLRVAQNLALVGEDFGAHALAELGIFHYECFSQTPIPYLRVGSVVRPLNIEDVEELDPASAVRLSGARLPVAFTDTEVLQPAEWLECSFWEQDYWWWAADGRVFFSDGNPHADPAMAMDDGDWKFARRYRDERHVEAFDFYEATAQAVESANQGD